MRRINKRTKVDIIDDIEELVANKLDDFQWYGQADAILSPNGGNYLVDDEFFNKEDFREVLQLRDEYLNLNKDMGKRRKPTRKPTYQSLGEIAEQQGIEAVPNDMRMAGDAFLDDLFQEAEEEKRQNQYLAQQLGRFATIDAQFERAGVPHQQVQNLQEIKSLANGVPAPYVDTVSKPGIERRVHTGVTKNPYTGELEIKAFENVDTGEALVTEFGRNVNQEGEEKASEYVQNHILKLMGLSPKRGQKGKVDFKADMGNGVIGIDGQTEATGSDPLVEILTKAIPDDRKPGGYGYGYDNDYRNKRAIKDNTRNLMRKQMAQGETVGSAIDNLVGNGLRNDPNIDGKLLKDDYDKVLMPMQNKEMHELNRKAKDTIAIAPDSVVMYDMNEIRSPIMESTDPDILRVAYNAGDYRSRDKQARAKVRGVVPQEYIRDVVAENPYVAQILSTLK